ncbi:hypothetical protein SAMN05428966_11867 [Massilia sp. PDC64]|nr:hypothetical protein [Massilia sp. PDC64]SDF63971.1 hypothetical protein SAMN05428966_11867 [Massilia sp. PDC64]
MSGRRFRYALEPLRLTRSWAVDELLAELAGYNERVAAQRAALDGLRAQLAQVRSDWLAGQTGGAPLRLERIALLARYLQDGGRREAEMAGSLAALETERDAVVARVAAARRALDAVEEHRGEARLAFLRARAKTDLDGADEHWSVLHGRRAEHESDG